MDWGLVLGREHHMHHHYYPFDRNYCITTGWLNGPLQAIGFWRALESIITKITGLIPREDDFYWNELKKATSRDEAEAEAKKTK